MKFSHVLTVALATVAFAAPVAAQTVDITTLDGSQGVAAPAGEMQAGSSATITSNTALDADGSLQLTGNRTRVLNGNNYAPTTNYGAADSIVSLTGDYLVLDGGSGGIQSPAFRVYVNTDGVRGELIWEAAYNGGYTLGVEDSAAASDLFWMYQAGGGCTGFVGTTGCGAGSYILRTAEDWGNVLGSNWFVSAFGVGQGGGAGTSFNALADNVVLTTTQGSLGYNFQAAAAVPEPGTWAMMLVGFGAIGAGMRRSKRRSGLAMQVA